MRIVSWNCNMAFRKKTDEILKYNPDILIIQECENIERLNINNFRVKPVDTYWNGNNYNKGIAIFSFNSYKLNLIGEPEKNDKWIIPFSVTGECDFYLFAVWAMNHRGNDIFSSTGPTYATFKKYSEYLKKDVIAMGDFNDNKIWDNKYVKNGNFSELVTLFKSYNIESCYHSYFSETYGEEKLKTLFWRKNIKTSYHIDYCFAKNSFINIIRNLEIGDHRQWLKISDHVPVILDFNIKDQRQFHEIAVY